MRRVSTESSEVERAMVNIIDGVTALFGMVIAARPALENPLVAVTDGSPEDVDAAAVMLSVTGNIIQAFESGLWLPERLQEAFGLASEESRALLMRNCTMGLLVATQRMQADGTQGEAHDSLSEERA